MLRPGLAHVREVLQSNRLIRKHLEQRERELALFNLVLKRLPDALRGHCRDVSLANGILTLFLDSPAWVTRARFASDDLARSLRSEGVVRVATQVRVASVEKPGSTRRHNNDAVEAGRKVYSRLSGHTIKHLLAAAEGMADQGLADRFRLLAQHQREAALTDRPSDAEEPLGARTD